VPPEKPDERLLIETLCWQLNEVIDASNATAGLKTIAAIITAARYARRTAMPAFLAASMLSGYIARGDPF
jgi:hypothetical protein